MTGPAQEPVSLLSWLREVADQNVADALGPAAVPVAWVARTSTDDMQDPTLSLPRQLDSVRRALPDGFVIVAHFYDVESGRTPMELRGRGTAHEQFDIPIPRDGGLADLMEEARRPDRRFVAVVCESVERIARTMYGGTRIEHELEQAGVALLAADEGIDRAVVPALVAGAAPAKRATPTLTRRVKQAIAEFYVLNMLELSWGGLKAHTDQGYNIGKPPYGYQAERLRHPVKAQAALGKVKHRLVIDPVRGPVVTQIFGWRALERLSYSDIAERLNADPDRYPPPDPIPGRGRRRIGAWTQNNVREVLDNPKHTGYMVWNRRKNPRQSRGLPGRVNPPSQWVWSSRPMHEPLVTRALFEAASTIGRFRRGSRSGSGRNPNPITTRTYVMRSYVVCDLCGRRMCGQMRKHYTYYRCGITKTKHRHQPWYDEHPTNVLIREDLLIEPLARFFTDRILGPHRAVLLEEADDPAERDDQRTQALQAEIVELRRRRSNVVEELQTYRPTGDPDVDTAWRDSLREQFATLITAERTKVEELSRIAAEHGNDQATDLINEIPQIRLDVTALPEAHQRQLYDAFHLEIRYNVHKHELTLRVTLDADTAPALAHLIEPQVCDASRAPGRA